MLARTMVLATLVGCAGGVPTPQYAQNEAVRMRVALNEIGERMDAVAPVVPYAVRYLGADDTTARRIEQAMATAQLVYDKAQEAVGTLYRLGEGYEHAMIAVAAARGAVLFAEGLIRELPQEVRDAMDRQADRGGQDRSGAREQEGAAAVEAEAPTVTPPDAPVAPDAPLAPAAGPEER